MLFMYRDLMNSIGYVTAVDPELGDAMHDELKR